MRPPLFPAPESRGTRTAAGGFALTGRLFFPAPESRGARTALACSPLTGGEFSAEPQWGDSPSADGGSVAAPAAGAKRKDNLRFSFLFELLPFPCLLIWRRLPICDRFENRERQSGYLSVCFATYSQFTDRLLLHIRATLRWVRHNSAARFVSALLRIVSAKINCTKRLIRRCRALQHAKELRDTDMSRLRGFNRMCSSTLSVNCEKAEKDMLW